MAKRRVLLVEDDLYTLELYEGELHKAGYDVIRAFDGEEGLAKARKEKPDLMLLDIMLPRLDGFEMLKALKADETTKAIPVIMLTNLSREEIVKEGFDLGASGYLVKASYTPAQVIDTINNFFTNPQVATPPQS